MQFEFTEEQKAWRQEVRSFIKENAMPELMEEIKDNTGANGPHYKAWIKKLAEKGVVGNGFRKMMIEIPSPHPMIWRKALTTL